MAAPTQSNRGAAVSLPGWPPRDWRALLALVASVAGAATLTGVACWLVWILWRGGWPSGTEGARIDALARALFGVLFIVGVVLISLGLAINRRSASFEASGGEEDPVTPVVEAAARGAASGATQPNP
jgi:TRAP-type C4-dicarboxylate transport system permease small subunit